MRPAIALCTLTLLAAGCTDSPGTARDDPSTPPPSQSSPTSAAPATPEAPAADDRALARAFVELAEDPGRDTLAAVPFAEEVRLGLGDRLEQPTPREQLARAAAWSIEAELFRGYVGPFSALQHVAEHAGGAPLEAFAVSVGPHPHCAGPPVPAPTGMEALRRIAVQPGPDTVDGCLEWFTVDLFVDGGQVVAVTLDLWEP